MLETPHVEVAFSEIMRYSTSEHGYYGFHVLLPPDVTIRFAPRGSEFVGHRFQLHEDVPLSREWNLHVLAFQVQGLDKNP